MLQNNYVPANTSFVAEHNTYINPTLSVVSEMLILNAILSVTHLF
jgi:hypothetical protein